jgi:hypothetical protein
MGAGGGSRTPTSCKARQILSLWNSKPISASIPPISTNAPDFSRIDKELQAGRKSPISFPRIGLFAESCSDFGDKDLVPNVQSATDSPDEETSPFGITSSW